MRTSCDATVSKEGSATLQARRLFDIVRLLPDADVRFKVDDGKWVTITCQKARFRLSGLPREDFPEIKEFDFAKGIPIERELLLDLINKVGFAISTDEGRYQITGALTTLNKRELTMVTTDGHRLAMARGRLEKGASESKLETAAKLTGFVSVKFKSETFPLERMVDVLGLQNLQKKAAPTPTAPPAAPAAAPAPAAATAPGAAR